MPSPFLTPGSHSSLDQLALLHLRRDHAIPTVLRLHDDDNAGYKEGKVTTTRFGSFPHSTLTDQPWGSQIGASKVDTGSRRGRGPQKKQNQKHLKRKAEELDSATTAGEGETPQAAVAAASGFLHLVYPTPELWTTSLPHRTQVVYTPDYSYILHRLRARPGTTIIEAGAGSGSFTHASVRAVFNGYPSEEPQPPKKRRLGKVCSFEFHEQRAEKVRQEISEHGLDGLVEVTHRDVYRDGFLLQTPKTGPSPKANAIFLDLPAPWLALKHLVRHPADGSESPLDPTSPVYLCTFSPCLEQVQRTISTLRQLSWLSISMVEVNHHRIEVRREKTGLEFERVRGAVVFPKDVDEAVTKMRQVEEHTRKYRESMLQNDDDESTPIPQSTAKKSDPAPAANDPPVSDVPAYNQGRLVHRSEQDLKTHTSYLVFAVLPREWSEEDERKCREKWAPHQIDTTPSEKPKGKRQMKREKRQAEEQREQREQAQAQAQAQEPAAAAATETA
ncbi:tRNA methyltransferase subunit GCD14 [Aspergillus ellipticus CBS 707.79]|uniref:tRNA (adenine(58)-N(1))-methyltransferase catalytic subunit TRM61 n=1 Tax=Aspergillus ellipticus CBS 707.79 TaxID=1448320 RepID=A0A319D4M1_9EURO|nr:tRNA methyltransferase subunit GCD14 [Aspergillus ellipticus CBS 707.79]